MRAGERIPPWSGCGLLRVREGKLVAQHARDRTWVNCSSQVLQAALGRVYLHRATGLGRGPRPR